MARQITHIEGDAYWMVINNINSFKLKMNKSWKEILTPLDTNDAQKHGPYPSLPSIARYTNRKKDNSSFSQITMTEDFVECVANMINWYIEPKINYYALYDEIKWEDKKFIHGNNAINETTLSGIAGKYCAYTVNSAQEERLRGHYLIIFPPKSISSSTFDVFFIKNIETEQQFDNLAAYLNNVTKIESAEKAYQSFTSDNNMIRSRYFIGQARINRQSLELDVSLEGKKSSFTKLVFPLRLYAAHSNNSKHYCGGIGMMISGLGFENDSITAQKIALIRCDESIPSSISLLNNASIYPFLVDSSQAKIKVDESKDREFYVSVIMKTSISKEAENLHDFNREDLQVLFREYMECFATAQKKAEEMYSLLSKTEI